MSDIVKYMLIFISTSSILVNATSSTKPTNNSSQTNIRINQNLIDNLTFVDYDFFTYDVIDHDTLLIKFDINSAIFFQQSNIIYDAYLYTSKIPNINHRFHIGSFSGYYEREIEGTITDHFTFCLILMPIKQQNQLNNSLINNQTKTIFHKYFKSRYQKRPQHVLHFCTKLGPMEQEHLHQKKHGTKGDHILLILQLMMIGIFLLIIQMAHMIKTRKTKERIHRYFERFRSEISTQKEPSELSDGALQLLRFVTINEELTRALSENHQEQNGDDEEEEEIKNSFLTVSHRRLPSPRIRRKRSRSPSPTFFGIEEEEEDDDDGDGDEPADASVEHILEAKPWIQIPKQS